MQFAIEPTRVPHSKWIAIGKIGLGGEPGAPVGGTTEEEKKITSTITLTENKAAMSLIPSLLLYY